MKLGVAAFALLAIVPSFAQEFYDPPPSLVRPAVPPVTPSWVSAQEMLRRHVQVQSYLTAYFYAPVTFKAGDVFDTGSILQFRGRVEIKTKSMILQADEVDFDRSTGQFSTRGNVVVKPVTE